MSVVVDIRAARRAHDSLRSCPPDAANLAHKADLYRVVKPVLDVLWTETDRPDAALPASEVRRAIRLLTVDAEYYAGLNDAEGFRDPSEAWGQYELLLRAFAGVGEPPNQPQHLTGGA